MWVILTLLPKKEISLQGLLASSLGTEKFEKANKNR